MKEIDQPTRSAVEPLAEWLLQPGFRCVHSSSDVVSCIQLPYIYIGISFSKLRTQMDFDLEF
jgi:hypothetical protein